jgi:hypothetical protein
MRILQHALIQSYKRTFFLPGYISTSIKDGPICLGLHCPLPSCNVAIDHDMIKKIASVEDQEKYRRFLYRSYVEDNRKVHCMVIRNKFSRM